MTSDQRRVEAGTQRDHGSRRWLRTVITVADALGWMILIVATLFAITVIAGVAIVLFTGFPASAQP
ncbi:hypothetical protein ACL02S_16610 [Nocardia sp. 004]|uniref:hypothetical protein n=1 Tax=Nocardia sp. 004 TaxID=3385978 RepID=UPI0039A10071